MLQVIAVALLRR